MTLSRFQFLAALPLGAALFLACSSSTSTSTGTTVYTCTANADCAGIGFVCDTKRLQCVCTSDAMCAATHATPYCNVFTGLCVAQHNGCTQDSCPQGQYCDESVRECTMLAGYCGSCTSDGQCGPNNLCVVHPDFPGTPTFCASACSSADGGDGTCPAAQTCETVATGAKQCVPTGQLCSGGNLSCTPDSLTPCTSDTNCMTTPGQKCNTTLSVCVAATSTCAPGQACDPRSMTCVLSCQANADCVTRYGDGFECLQHTCVPQGECTNDSECSSTQFCLMPAASGGVGTCTATCTKNSDCPIGEHCGMNPATGRNACSAGCTDNSECGPTEICNNGACEGGHCQISAACPFAYSCVDYSCVQQVGQCSAASNGCPSGAQAADVYFCCSGSSCPTVAGLQCGTVAGCPGNSGCHSRRCLLPCGSDADCSNGFACESIAGASGSYCQVLIGDGQNCVLQ